MRTLFLLFASFYSFLSFAQTSIPAATLIKQQFNSITTTVPANWKLSGAGEGVTATWNSANNTATVGQSANSGTPESGGSYNWGNAGSTDRSLGFMTDGSYGSPNAVMAYYQNKTGASISSLTLSFTVERYRTNTSSFSLSLYSSTDGTAWTVQPTGDITAGVFPTGASAYDFSATTNVTKSVTLPLSVANDGDIYFKWVFVTGGNSQGLGLDDVSIYAGNATPVMVATLTDSLSVDNGVIKQANGGDVITYKTVIKNNGSAYATGVQVTFPAVANTTAVPGSAKTSAVAADDAFTAFYNTALSSGNVLSNDYGLPSLSVVSFGPTGDPALAAAGGTAAANGGGTISVAANGTFTYTPPAGFSGTDKFAYIAGTGTLPNNKGIVTITVGPDISISTTPVNLTCGGASNGQLTITASAGTGTLTYSVTGSGGSYQASNVFTGLTAGSYTVAVKDATGYIKTTTASITEPAAIFFNTVNVNNNCNGTSLGSITVNATGGTGTLTYSKNNGSDYQASNTFSGLAAGTYQIVVKDANNCTSVQGITLTDPALLSFTKADVNVTCNGGTTGSIAFTASGGTSPYTFSNSGLGGTYGASNTFTGLTAATYSLAVKDAAGCTTTGSSTLTQPAAITVSGTSTIALTYNIAMATQTYTKTNGVGIITWTASGLPTGVNLGGSTGSLTGTPTITGTFNVTITATDENGCTGTKAVTIMVAPNLSDDSYDAVGNTQLVAAAHSTPTTPATASATTLLANDASDGAIAITAVTDASTSPANSGTITIDASGRFTYSPAPGFTGTASYSYTGTANSVSATATINFTVSSMVWYVNNSNNAGDANGTSAKPFKLASSASSAALVNHYIYVHTGSTGGDVTLKAGQTLRGAGSALSVGALSLAAGTKPTLSGKITLANSVIVDGFDMLTGANTALSSSGSTSVNVNIGNVTSSGAVNAVSLTNTTGTVVIAGGTQTNSTGATFNISGGSVNLTYSGSISQGANAAMVNVASGHTGTLTFQTGTLSATAGTGLQFDNADGAYNFNVAVTLNGGDAGIDILNSTGASDGSFTFADAPISNPTGIGLKVIGGNGTITHTGAIAKSNAGYLVDIQSRSGGSITLNSTLSNTTSGGGINIASNTAGTLTMAGNLSLVTPNTGIFMNLNSGGNYNFSGGTKTISTTTAPGVNLTSNGGSTINFSNGGLAITTTTGNGFSATGGAAAINITGTNNTVTSTTGIAVNVVSSIIGASGITLKSVSANGAANGIYLSSTGSNAFSVTGDGANWGSGGTIKNTTGTDGTSAGNGIYLNNVQNVSFSYVLLSDHSNNAIYGTSVTGFSVSKSRFTGLNGNSNSGTYDESVVNLNNTGGALSFTDSYFSGGAFNTVRIENIAGTSPIITSLSFSKDTLTAMQGSTSDVRSTALLVSLTDGTLTSGTIQNCKIDSWWGNAIHVLCQGTSAGTISILSNSCINTNGALAGAGGIWVAGGTLTYTISKNDVQKTNGTAISADRANFGSIMTGTISENTIGTSGVSNSGSATGIAIFASHHGPNSTFVRIKDNIIRQVNGSANGAITVNMGDDVGFGGTGNIYATITGNNIQESGSVVNNAQHGILVTVGATSGDTDNGCYDISGNIITNFNMGSVATSQNRIRINHRFNTTARFPGYSGGQFSITDLRTYLLARNTASNCTNATSGTGGGFLNTSGGAACQ